MVQANLSRSRANVLRGLHVHRRQADYWCVLDGAARVGLYDLRGGSPTEGVSSIVDLAADDARCLLIPAGVAHGFYTPGGRPAPVPGGRGLLRKRRVRRGVGRPGPRDRLGGGRPGALGARPVQPVARGRSEESSALSLEWRREEGPGHRRGRLRRLRARRRASSPRATRSACSTGCSSAASRRARSWTAWSWSSRTCGTSSPSTSRDCGAVINIGGLSNDPTAEFDPRANEEMNTHASIRVAEVAKARRRSSSHLRAAPPPSTTAGSASSHATCSWTRRRWSSPAPPTRRRSSPPSARSSRWRTTSSPPWPSARGRCSGSRRACATTWS